MIINDLIVYWWEIEKEIKKRLLKTLVDLKRVRTFVPANGENDL